MKGQLTLANVVTTGSLVAGFAALMLAGDGRMGAALALVAVAAVLDSIDGPIARRATTGRVFGGHLDALADHAAFGVAPAFMLHESALHTVPVAGPAACLAFVVAGAWRLARFGSAVDDRLRFAGLPLPPAGLIAAIAAAISLAPALALVLVVVLAATMVSEVPFPTFAGIASLLRPARPVPSGVPRHHRRFDRARARQGARRRRHDGQRHPKADEDERVGAPALARE